MKLVDNWRAVLKHASSVKFMALSLLIIALEPVVDVLVSLTGTASIATRLVCNGLAGLFTVAAIIARVVAQRKLQPKDPSSGEEQWPD